MSAQNTIREEDYALAVTLLQRHHLLRHAAGKDAKLDEDTADFFATACPHPTHYFGTRHPSDGLFDAVCHDCGVNTESDDPATAHIPLLSCKGPECDCENPEPEGGGAALVSNRCPIHNENPITPME